jgi:plastocyanin
VVVGRVIRSGPVARIRDVGLERRAAWLLASALLVAIHGPAPLAPDAARAADATVLVVDFDFEPPTVTIEAGDTVTWIVTRADDPHTVSPLDPPDAFEGSELLRAGETFAVTFAEAGTVAYLCLVHPEDMRATVIVRQAPDASPAPTTTNSPSPVTPSPGLTAAPTPTAPSAPGDDEPDPTWLLAAVVATGAVLALGAAWLRSRGRATGG